MAYALRGKADVYEKGRIGKTTSHLTKAAQAAKSLVMPYAPTFFRLMCVTEQSVQAQWGDDARGCLFLPLMNT